MLRIRRLGASAIALVAGAGMAVAADFPTYEAPPSSPVYNATSAFTWTGPYAGLTGGYGWGGGTVSHNGWIAGAYAGYNFQTDTNLVVGVEGDITATGKSGSSGGVTVSNPWNGTVRGRIGYAADRFLLYGTGGLALGRVKAVSAGPTTETATRAGWTAGVGVEAALSQNIVARGELRHTSLGSTTFPSAGTVSTSSNDVMVGIGFKY
jgi:outer membrane immunogenic protein